MEMVSSARILIAHLHKHVKNLELLIVNDGSDDSGKTEHVALSYGDKIRYISKSNGGVASALNRAIEEMSGDYFSWLSHDDLYVTNKIEEEIKALSYIGRDDVIVYSDYSVFTDNPDETIPVYLKGVPPKHFRYWITVENKLHGCTLLIPRSAFEVVGVFNENLKTTQDYDLWYRMSKEFEFVHIPKQLVKARSHAEQGSLKMGDIALNECNALLSNFVSGLETDEIISATGKPLAECYVQIASNMYERGFDKAGNLAEKFAAEYDTGSDKKVMAVKKKSIRIQGSRFIDMGRKYLPPKLKHKIKTAIRSVSNRVVSKSKDRGDQLQEKFSEIYEKNIFGGRLSRSGEGSDLVQTEVIRRELPKIVKEYSVKSFLDAPCGDWFWMKETNLEVEQYIGVDIVEAVIKQHEIDYGSPSIAFMCLNLVADSLPKADLIFSRDCLVHLSFEDALNVIENFKKSGAKYLLTTTFNDMKKNNDLVDVDNFWRPLNMCLAPFNFPQPILFVNEECTEEVGHYSDKGLGLWLMSDINLCA